MYRDDAAYLLRLEAAVAKDDRRTEAWRNRAIGHLHKAAIMFLEADSEILGSATRPDKAPKAGRKTKASRPASAA
jgi:hypothetical protein